MMTLIGLIDRISWTVVKTSGQSTIHHSHIALALLISRIIEGILK